MVYTLHEKQVLPKPINEVFRFFERPENLAMITPPWVGFQILTPRPIVMEKNRVLDYQIRVCGFPQHWRSIITEYNPPHFFADEQLKGPYAFWHHTHRFEEEGNNTVVVDEIRYALPFGVLGKAAHFLFVKRQLRQIFTYRRQKIQALFPAS